MFSYIFMKILESRPSQYDKGINFITAGHAKRVRKEIVERWIKPRMKVLDIGCGSGELLARAAQAGADVSGIDISADMLSIAKKRIQKDGACGKANLYHAGVTDLDKLFKDCRLDIVTSTLVFSELYTAERYWAYSQIHRLLTNSGLFIIAGEVRPRSIAKRILHFLVRLPLAIVTYLITQSGTKALADMAGELDRAGFEVIGEKRSLLDSFSVVWARKNPDALVEKSAFTLPFSGDRDISLAKTAWDYFGRWFPNPVEPGLRKIGMPGKADPVFVTGNFHLTVRRVEKALSSMNAWLLVAPTRGINVWCAASGGELTAQRVTEVLKASGISEKVSHRHLILPQFSASGIDIQNLKKETGYTAVFGPAYAKDIPEYLKKGQSKSRRMCLAEYSLLFRLEMLVAMQAMAWFPIAVILLFVKPLSLFDFSLFYWGAGLILYTGYPWLPGKSGWLKGLGLAVLFIIAIGLEYSASTFEFSFKHWGWMSTALIVCFWLGFDLRGIVEGSPSEATRLMDRLGIHSLGSLYSSRSENKGILHFDTVLCSQCRTCINVCPKGVFDLIDSDNNVHPVCTADCFNCGACIRQCPEGALTIS